MLTQQTCPFLIRPDEEKISLQPCRSKSGTFLETMYNPTVKANKCRCGSQQKQLNVLQSKPTQHSHIQSKTKVIKSRL
ncbi:hypothetical protein V5799_021285 [Amblyomma americanum]|uniref:Uncharacterized protein n=1 Tax=Amblyomma americanum TaxID=6943 RepID=A0AAQ4FQW0_AMBAM